MSRSIVGPVAHHRGPDTCSWHLVNVGLPILPDRHFSSRLPRFCGGRGFSTFPVRQWVLPVWPHSFHSDDVYGRSLAPHLMRRPKR